MLRQTGSLLKKIPNIDMVYFFRNNIRGSVSQCSKQSAWADNPYHSDYDRTKPTSYLLHFDVTQMAF